MGLDSSASFWIILSIFLFVYSAVSILLFLRKKHRYILSRSPTILQIGHWSNLGEIAATMIILYDSELHIPPYPALFWLFESWMNISHYLMVLCYLIRAYRIYFVFNLDSSKDNQASRFTLKGHRVTQRWAIQLIFAIISPIIIICVSIFLLMIFTGESFGIFIGAQRSTYLYMVDSFMGFFLQMLMIIMMNMIRNVENEFQMLKEMFIATILLFATPLFSLFVHILNKDWMLASVFRNLMLMLITSIFPIIMSFLRTDKFEIMSLEMLTSFELVLHNQISLNSFEYFLKRYDHGNGAVYLDIFLRCQCCLDTYDALLANSIMEKIAENNIILPDDGADADDSSQELQKILNYTREVLECDYFFAFKGSEEYEKLRGFMYRQEVLNTRLSLTSFMPKASPMKHTLVSLIDLYSND